MSLRSVSVVLGEGTRPIREYSASLALGAKSSSFIHPETFQGSPSNIWGNWEKVKRLDN